MMRRWPFTRIIVTALVFAIVCVCMGMPVHAAAAGEGEKPKKDKSVGRLRSEGDEAMMGGDTKKAGSLFSEAIKLEPDNHQNYYKRFRVKLRERQYQSAINDLTSAINLKADFKQGYAQRGKLFITIGECEMAMKDYKELMRIEPANKDHHNDLSMATQCAEALTQADRYDNGVPAQLPTVLKHLNTALELTSAKGGQTGSVTLLMRRARCYYAMNDYYQVSSDTGKVLKIDKNNLEAYLLRGNGYYKLGEHDMAKKHWQECLRSDPEMKGCKTANSQLKKIMRYMKKGDKNTAEGRHMEAIQEYAEAIKVDDKHGVFNRETTLTIVKIYNKAGKPDDAIEWANFLLNVCPYRVRRVVSCRVVSYRVVSRGVVSCRFVSRLVVSAPSSFAIVVAICVVAIVIFVVATIVAIIAIIGVATIFVVVIFVVTIVVVATVIVDCAIVFTSSPL
jgi:tetratricopeptide (TPR) repeat protein